MSVYQDVIHQQYTPKSSKRQNVALNGFFTFNATNVYLHSSEDFYLNRCRVFAVLLSYSVGAQTPAERIMEGSLSARRP